MMGFLFESFLHALVDAVLVGAGLRVWGIVRAEPRQRFLSLIVILPALTPTLFRMQGFGLGWPVFYRGALFDGGRWLRVELFHIPIFRWVFFCLTGLCVAAFLFQELLPIFLHFRQSKSMVSTITLDHQGKKIPLEVLAIPPIKELEGLDIRVLPDHEADISSISWSRPSILIGERFLKILDQEELRAVIAHEIAHLGMDRKPFMILMYAFRMLGFFNPVVLGAFRFVAHEEECLCDDRAVWLTSSDPLTLAGALEKLYQIHFCEGPGLAGWEQHGGISRNLSAVGLREQLFKRISRLRLKTYDLDGPGYWPELVIVILGCLAFSFGVTG